MSFDDDIAAHYGAANLLQRIETGLVALGADPAAPAPEDLKPVDEFHTGGIEATEALLSPLSIGAGTRVLDIGCGIGGTVRYIARHTDAEVTGLDLTPAYVAVAAELTRRVGLDARTRFLQGSALEMPFADAAFDLATMFHVGMNIADKGRLFAEVARVLAPGGRFALFDIMRGDGAGEIGYPAPWSPDATHSFVAPPQDYRDAAAGAGLRLVAERDRGDFARAYFQKVTAAIEAHGPPPVGLHLLMGEEAPVRYGNAVTAAMARVAAPWEMVFERPS